MIRAIIKWAAIALLVMDLAFVHVRLAFMEHEHEIIWCIIYPKPPFCTLGDKHGQAPTTPNTQIY